MRYLFVFALFLAPLGFLAAQNAFLQLFHVQYQELTPLITDSLYIRIQIAAGGETTRAIGYRHPEDLPPSWHEVRTQEMPLGLWRISQQTKQGANGQITYNDFVDSLRSDTLRNRLTTFSIQPDRPDSILSEIWRNGQWEPVQKSIFIYAGQKLGRRLEFSWNNSSGLWENVSFTAYQYDGQKRMTQREEQKWIEDSWNLQHTCQYAYRPNENKPKYSIWQTAGIRQDSTVTWYDFEGQEDSTKIYHWNEYLLNWGLDWKRILNSNEAKKALAGNTYVPSPVSISNVRPMEQREFIAGEGVFTDEPQEELLRIFNPVSNEWQDKWRRTINYKPISDSIIYGTIHITEFGKDSTWSETFFAEGWFHRISDSLHNEPVKDRTDTFTFSYTCGFYNPYVQSQTISFPATEVTGDYELKIFGEDGHLVFQQRYDSSGLATVSASLIPGLYLVAVSRGGTPLCTQKLVVY